MGIFDEDDRVKSPVKHEIGQDLSQLSLEDIDRRVALMEAEIARLKEARLGKQASRQAADAVFKS